MQWHWRDYITAYAEEVACLAGAVTPAEHSTPWSLLQPGKLTQYISADLGSRCRTAARTAARTQDLVQDNVGCCNVKPHVNPTRLTCVSESSRVDDRLQKWSLPCMCGLDANDTAQPLDVPNFLSHGVHNYTKAACALVESAAEAACI